MSFLSQVFIFEFIGTNFFPRSECISQSNVEVLRTQNKSFVQVGNLGHDSILLLVEIMLQMRYSVLIFLASVGKTCVLPLFSNEIYNLVWS